MNTGNSAPVAVLDDDVQFIRMVQRILESDGVPTQPVTTPDLDEAVRVVAMTGCRAALVDIYMYGEAAGFTLVERLRQHPVTANIPIVVTSGAYREIARRVPFLKQYGCSVLPKPFEVDALLARINGDHHPELTETHNGSDFEESEFNSHGRKWFLNPFRRIPERVARTA